MVESRSTSVLEPIAIIGSGCRFPGQSSAPSKLWQLLREPRDVQTKIPANRFNPHAFYHPDHGHHGTSNVRHSYLLEGDPRHFDAQFFGIKPAEAHCIDPQHRILLETVYESLESAGLRVEDLRGSQTAVYVGLMCGDYSDMIMRDPESLPTYAATGTARSILSNRVSYFFDWHGPCMTIDTACSSSLVAVHEALQTLRAGHSRVAIAAGSNLCLAAEPYIAESKLQMLSPTGRSRMWDSKADGYARGDGVAAVVLKTLSSALADGDDIECLIRETGVNQDGRTKGITMPSAVAQTILIRDTYKRAGLDVRKEHDRCQYFEAHGTGTPTGDPLEAEAICNAFFPPDDQGSYNRLYVGSVKTVIGHTEGTAGLAGLLKASLALRHGIIPPNMLFDELNPNIEPFYANFRIPTTAQPWPTLSPGSPRRASVNSFGFGGTNAHAILEAYEAPPNPSSPAEQVSFTPLLLSASSETSLSRTLETYSHYIQNNPSTNIRDLTWTLHSRRSRLPFSTSISGATLDRLLVNIRARLDETDGKKQPLALEQQPSRLEPPCVLGVFTGQGAQWATMGRELWQSPKVRGIFQSLDDVLQSLPAKDRPTWTLCSEFTADAPTSRIETAEVSQPMCTAVQIVLVQLLGAAGMTLDAVVGHSSGEIAAAYVAGFLSAEDAIRIAYYRGVCSQIAQGPNGERGAMMAVGTSYDDAAELCEEPEFKGRLNVAAVNSSVSVTLSGDAEAIEMAKEVLDEEKKFARILVVDKAYHSHHMIASSDCYIGLLRNSRIMVHHPSSSACAWYSSVRGGRITESVAGDLADVYWNKNMINPVLFSQAIESAVADWGRFTVAIEIGSHPALRGPITQVLQDLQQPPLQYIPTLQRGMNDVEAMASCLGLLWQHLPPSTLSLSKYDAFVCPGAEPQVVKDLPSYAWDHDQIFWFESRMWEATRTRNAPVHPLLGTRCPDGVEQEFRWRNFLSPRELPWLSGHRIQGQMVFPAAGYISTAIEAAKAMKPSKPIQLIEILDLVIPQATIFSDENSSVETVVSITNITSDPTNKNTLLATFSFYSASGKDSTMMIQNASSRIRTMYGPATADALPMDRPSLADMIDIPSERFYNSLETIGYSYTGPFRALVDMKRKLGITTGLVTRHPTPDSDSLILHPAMLDASIQAVILARSFPGDGELWSLQVPKGVLRIAVNPSQCGFYDPSSLIHFPIDSVLTQMEGSVTKGDIDIYSPDGQYTIARMEGVHAVPVEAATVDNDRPFFSGVIWQPSSPDPMAVPFPSRATCDEYELAYVMERVAVFYLKQIHLSFPYHHSARKEGLYVGLLRFATHVSELVASGGHSYARQDWAQDTHSDILRESRRYPDNIDLKVMHLIAENINNAIDGRSDILETLTKNKSLDRYYEQAMGISYYTGYLSRVVSSMMHRYPHMKILEIGGGTGGATKKILNQTGTTFLSYTFTDVSSGFFENARDIFTSHQDKTNFQVLDIEKDVVVQGFSEGTYDLVIASFVLHATSKLEATLRNVRRLLKPGGYLAMLEVTNLEQSRLGYIFGSLPGWWLGADDGRVLSPCVANDEWDRLLRQTGFSGIDTVTSDIDALPFPTSAIVSQATNATVEFIRNPLKWSADFVNRNTQVVVVGGVSPTLKGMRQKILDELLARFDLVSVVDHFENLPSISLSPGALSLNLSDLDEPIFRDMTAESLAALKLLYERSSYLLWVTEDCRAGNPHHNQSLGFGRSMVVEMPQVQSQFLDLDSIDASSATVIVSALLRFLGINMTSSSGRTQHILWTTEPEIAIVQGKEMIPRVQLNQDQNLRYNASRRLIEEEIDPRSENVRIESNDLTYSLFRSSVGISPSTSTVTGHVRVRVDASSLVPMRLSANTQLYIISGTVLSTAEPVIGFVGSNASTVEIPKHWMTPVRGLSPKEVLPHAVSHTIARAIISSVDEGGLLVAAEPDRLIAPTLEFYASQKGVRVIFVTSNTGHKPSSWLYVHPQAHFRSLRKALPQGPVSVVDMSTGNNKEGLADRLRDVLHCSSSFMYLASFFGGVPRCKDVDCPASTIRIIDTSQNLYSQTRTTPIQYTFIPIGDVSRVAVDNEIPASFLDWSSTQRVTTVVRPIHQSPLLRGDRTYWLVGLTGSLGISLCHWMIQSGARYVVLTSRNPKINSEILAGLLSSEARVEIYAGDATDRESLRGVYDRICRTLPPIAGVAQGAMVLRDTMIENMDIEAMRTVLHPKVQGSINLDELFSQTTGPPLDFFVFFSSATCVTGNFGQSNYAAANMFMTSLAANRRRRGLAGSVIHIGAIMGVGYVTRETTEALQQNLLKNGHVWMSENDFHTIFAEAILAGLPSSSSTTNVEIICGLRLNRESDEQRALWSYNPKFQHLVIQEEKATEMDANSKSRISLKHKLQEAQTPDQIFEAVKDSFISKLQLMLGLTDMSERSVIDKAADELGIDSLNIVEIRSWFLKELRTEIPVLRILGGATIREIIRFALERLPPDMSPNLVTLVSNAAEEGAPLDAGAVQTPLISV